MTQTCTSMPLLTPAIILLLALGAQQMWGRHPNETDRTVQRRCGLALMAGSTLHLTLFTIGAGPDALGQYVAHPEIAAHFLEDLVALPVFVLNLGHLAGVDRWGTRRCVVCIVLSAAGILGTAVFAPVHIGAGCLIVSLGALAAASADINE